MNKLILIVAMFVCMPGLTSGQRNAHWILGYNTSGFPNGFNDLFEINFSTPIPNMVLLDTVAFASLHTNTSISDISGNLLFYTNGITIKNAFNSTMLNGDTLNPNCNDYYFVNGAYGVNAIQAALPLNDPGNPNRYYLIHQGYYSDDFSAFPYPYYYCDTLYYSIIDMTLDSGRGAVISKNQHLWVGSLPLRQLASIGSLTACKHANGRDWWVISHRDSSSEFMTFLISPQGITGPFYQNIGPLCLEFKGQSVFSPDGSKYAFFQFGGSRIHLFDFDRCSGLFSNYINITNINAIHYGSIGAAFSPNSRYLYTSSYSKIVQWDTYATNIANSKVIVAEPDTIPCPNYNVYFYLMQLAPNGKIYVSTPSSSHCLTVINYPDSPGLSCDAVPRGLALPRSNGFSVPNHPNYELGSISGSVCDSLTSLTENSYLDRYTIKIVPNPGNGNFRLSFPVFGNEPSLLQLTDVFGKIIYQTHLTAWTSVYELELKGIVSSGLYMCRITSENKVAIGKLIIEE